MKRKYFSFTILLIAVFYLGACKKLSDIQSLNDFNVTSDKQQYNIGDTVIFTINKDADAIVFYSGLPGMSVDNRNRMFEPGTNTLKFETLTTQGNKTNNNDSLLLKIGTNLKSYDSAGIANATWVDITNTANWPAIASNVWMSSGKLDISSFNVFDSVIIAFQYLGKQNPASAQRKWQIRNLTLNNVLADNYTTPLFAPPFTGGATLTTDTAPNFAATGWAHVNIKNTRMPSFISTNFNFSGWNVGEFGINVLNPSYVINARPCNANGIPIQTAYPITFDPSNVVNTPDNEDWLLTSPVNLKTVRRDFPTAVIKNAVSTNVKGMKYVRSGGIFATYSFVIDASFVSGKTYNMAFVAQNFNVNQKNEVIKSLQIAIN